MPFFDTLVAVVPMLGILIVVHELGHFLAAKAFGVRVLRFSIGFGTPLGFGKLRAFWERNGTEYVVGWIPLGGFVRMLGENLPGDDPVALGIPADARRDEFLDAKPLWQKLAILFAGPGMNLLLPIVCLVGVLWVGYPDQAPVVGAVEEGSPAALAGLLTGDRVVSIDGEPTTSWDEVVQRLQALPAETTAQLAILRAGESRTVSVQVMHRKMRDRFGAVVEAGWIGITHARRAALVGVPSTGSPAARAGIRSGDLVVAVEGQAVGDWEALRTAQASAITAARTAGRSHVAWKIERAVPREGTVPNEKETATSASSPAPEPKVEEKIFELPLEAELDALGLIPATILVEATSADKPAAQAGVRPNDLILYVDGRGVGTVESFVQRIQTSGGRPVELTLAREGRVEQVVVAPREEKVASPFGLEGQEERVYQIGIALAPAALPGVIEQQQIRNPLRSLPRATAIAWGMTSDFLVALSKLFTGEVGTDKISGPIGIARIARKSLDAGWFVYLNMMMLISINLGFVNLLPIPILDGGQALLATIEGIKRAPLSLRTREITTSVGIALIALLMGRAFWNDLTPFWLKFVDWLSRSPS